MTAALTTVASHLHRLWSRRGAGQPFGALLREYDAHHALVGRRVSVVDRGGDERAVSGRCEGLDEMGRLLLRSRPDKLERVVCGHVQLI
jgi:biotin-(acetyl-CoA carboxylase) ligase